MKITQCLLIASLTFLFACSSVKTRKEAAEDAKMKAASGESAPYSVGPIEEEEYDAAGASGVPKPVDDQILNDELAAMGIDPSNPDGRKNQGTPEPEVHGNPVPMPEPALKKQIKKPAKKKTKKSAKKKQ